MPSSHARCGLVVHRKTTTPAPPRSLSIVASHHGIPFFIAAPSTTLDPALPDGSHITIEQREPSEITHFK